MNKILIIDDDRELCALIKRSVQAENIEADFCNTGKEGLQKLKDQEYQLVVLDVMMPGMDGFETLEEIRKEYSLPIDVYKRQTLYLPLFLNDAVPEEHKSGIDMSRDLLRRSHVLVVCGHSMTEAMKNDIAVAQRLGITATTLEGILTVKGQGRR